MYDIVRDICKHTLAYEYHNAGKIFITVVIIITGRNCQRWKAIVEKEFLAFTVIIIFMGVVKLSVRTSSETSYQHSALNRYCLIGTGLLCLRVKE